ncbi:MAG: DUF3712 domain-containing protein [Promethearchaeota archaeon]
MEIEKNKLIAIIVALAIIVPSTSIGIYFGVKNIGQKTIEDAEIEIDNVEVNSADDNSLNVTISGSIKNPSQLSGNLDGADLTIEYQNKTIGTTQMQSLSINAGITNFTQNLSITVTNKSNYLEFVGDFIKNSSISLGITGDVNISSGAISFSTKISKVITLKGLNNELSFSVQNFGIIDANSTSFDANVTIEINNPSSISLFISQGLFAIYVNNSVLGNLSLNNLKIMSGDHNYTMKVVVNIEDENLFTNVSNDILSNISVDLEFRGIASDNNLLSRIFSELDLGFTMPGFTPAECVILDVTLINSSSNSVTFSVDLEIYAPIISSIELHNLTFNTTYKNEELGLIDFGNITVYSGDHIYSVNSTLTFTNTSLLSDLLTDYLNGSVITLYTEGISNGTDIISEVINGYKQNITLPSSPDFTYDLQTLKLVNSTNSSLTFNSTIEITNPNPLNVTLQSLLFNVSYQGSWIGNITLNNEELNAGVNNISVQVILSDSENKSAVEDFLSNYVSGNDVSLYVYGNISLLLAGMTSTLNITITRTENFAGLDKDIIKSVRLNFIVLTMDWGSSTFNMQANVNATISNPFDFDINVTYIYYKIYFDDDDGFSIPFIISYPPKNHIYLDTIEHNYTSSPEQVVASSDKVLNEVISSNNAETCSRLYDEYYNDNDLAIDIESGILEVKIGGFTATLNFNFADVPVPNS